MDVSREDRAGRLRVFLLRMSQVRPALPWLQTVLSRAECTRAAGMAHASAREEFMVGRAVLRLLLARRLAVSARDIALCIGHGGKPGLAQDAPDSLAFNVSHTRGVVALAVGGTAAVGIDVERVDREAPVEQLAEAAWGSKAATALKAIACPTERCLTFFRQWVRFEAVAKWDGRGIAAMAKSADTFHQESENPALAVQEFDATTAEFEAVGCVVVAGGEPVGSPEWLGLEELLALRDG